MQRKVDETGAVSDGVLPLCASRLTLSREGRVLLDDVGLQLGCDDRISVLLGPNGAGKSLLIRVLADLIRADSGSVTWAGHAPDLRRIRRIGLVFAKPVLLRRSVMANMDYVFALAGVPKPERPHAIGKALARAGLDHLARQDVHALSSGEQQRLALARAIASAPDVLILDEPTANLDPASTGAIETQLCELRDRAVPILFITHDLAQAQRLADRVIFMHAGKILETTPAEEFFRKPRTQFAQRFIRGELLV